jgi:hypothetical protein
MMDLNELAELQKCGSFKKKREIFEQQLQILINDDLIFKDFKE